MAENSALSPVSLTSYFDPKTGAPLQVDLYFYKANTLDLITVYTDSLLAVPHPSPVPASGYGRVPPVYVGQIPAPGYRVRTFNQWGELVEDLDNLPGAAAPATGGGGGEPPPDPTNPDALYKTGDLIFAWSNAAPRSGAVLANGNTIGNAVSNATAMAHADAHDLFVLLWQQDVEHLLVVASGGTPNRGSSAQGDWDAGKTIALPDYRNRVPVGLDAMGASGYVNRLGGAVLDAGSHPGILGAYGGRAVHTLTDAQLPPHSHTLSDPGHTHSGWTGDHAHSATAWTDAQGAHSHNISIGGAGWHDHGYTRASPVTGYVGYFEGFAGPAGARTDGAGDHSHSASADVQGNHGHNVGVSVAAVGNIGVGIAAALTGMTISTYGGGGQYHPQVQPFLAICVYIKL